jgi:hypothetical protein
MLNKSLMLLSALTFCLTSLGILLSDAQQRALALWNIRAWSTLDGYRQALISSRIGKILKEEPPADTALMTFSMFAIGLISAGFFACSTIFSAAACLGGLLLAYDGRPLDDKDFQLIALYGAMAGVSLTGLIVGAKGFLLSAALMIVAMSLLPLSAIEFVARRIAEYDKGPLVTLGVLVAAVLAFFKAL